MQATRPSIPYVAAIALVSAVITSSCASTASQPQGAAAQGAPTPARPAQGAPTQAAAEVGAEAPMETSRVVAGGGISVPGWTGRIDAKEMAAGQTLSNAKFAREGNNMRVTTGPAVTYWNPANRATGDYTVRATFTEPQYMSLNDHPHPYGIVIGGNDMGTDQQSYLYCATYGNGNVIVRGFGPEPFRMNGPRGAVHATVNRAAGPGQPVTQDIAVSVRGDKVECSVNGTVVGSYDKAAVVTPGKLKSTDGIYGIRFAHNTDGIVSNFTMTRP